MAISDVGGFEDFYFVKDYQIYIWAAFIILNLLRIL